MHRNVLAKLRFLPEINRCQIRPFFVVMPIYLWEINNSIERQKFAF